MQEYQGRICPHCGNDKANMQELRFTRGTYFCTKCHANVQDGQLIAKMVYVTPEHWGKRMPIINPDEMKYDAPNPGNVFDHIKGRGRGMNGGKYTRNTPLKIYKRG